MAARSTSLYSTPLGRTGSTTSVFALGSRTQDGYLASPHPSPRPSPATASPLTSPSAQRFASSFQTLSVREALPPEGVRSTQGSASSMIEQRLTRLENAAATNVEEAATWRQRALWLQPGGGGSQEERAAAAVKDLLDTRLKVLEEAVAESVRRNQAELETQRKHFEGLCANVAKKAAVASESSTRDLEDHLQAARKQYVELNARTNHAVAKQSELLESKLKDFDAKISGGLRKLEGSVHELVSSDGYVTKRIEIAEKNCRQKVEQASARASQELIDSCGEVERLVSHCACRRARCRLSARSDDGCGRTPMHGLESYYKSTNSGKRGRGPAE